MQRIENDWVCFGRSGVHGWSLFARLDIQEGKMIGVILMDSHGIAQVKSVTGSKILRILKVTGGLPPAQTLDMLCTHNYYLIDIRSEKEKKKAGIPQLPPSAKSRMIAILYRSELWMEKSSNDKVKPALVGLIFKWSKPGGKELTDDYCFLMMVS